MAPRTRPNVFQPPFSSFGSDEARMNGHSGLSEKLANLTTFDRTRPSRSVLWVDGDYYLAVMRDGREGDRSRLA